MNRFQPEGYTRKFIQATAAAEAREAIAALPEALAEEISPKEGVGSPQGNAVFTGTSVMMPIYDYFQLLDKIDGLQILLDECRNKEVTI